MSELVRQFATTVKIDGIERRADRVTIDREIATSLPAQVAGGGGIVKATGDATFGDPGRRVQLERHSPWTPRDGWPPQRTAPVTIDTSVNDGPPSRRFTGRIFDVSGSAREPVRVEFEDTIDDLKVNVSHEALDAAMPPVDGESDWRLVGLRSDYLANVAFRAGGFWVTPPAVSPTLLSVPAQGSLWPESGVCHTCLGFTTGGFPTWHAAPWGWAVAGVDATYRQPGAGTIDGRGILVGAMVAPDHSGLAIFNVRFERVEPPAASAILSVRVTKNRYIQVAWEGVAVTTFQPPGEWTRFQVTHDRTNIVCRTDTGWESSFQHTIPQFARVLPYRHTRIQADGSSRVAGLMVAYVPGNDAAGYVTTPLNARIQRGLMLEPMDAMPALTSRNGLDLLREISEATCTAMWIDREGVLRWVHSDWLRNQNPTLELDSTADLLDMAWRDTADSARRSVTVTYRQATRTRYRSARATVWEGSGEALRQGESLELIVSPPADQDWLEVDTAVRQMLLLRIGTSWLGEPDEDEAIANFNLGVGSWVVGTPMNAAGETVTRKQQQYLDDPPDIGDPDPDWFDHSYPSQSWSMTRIGPAAWKITLGLYDISDNYWRDLQGSLDLYEEQRSPINQQWGGQKSPLIRAKELLEWTDEEHTSTITGPSRYEALEHDAGPFVRPSGIPALADWLAEQVTQPAPILQDLPIVWRDDVDLGQVVDVVEDAVYHVRLRCLVVGLSESHAEAEAKMQLTCRVISAESTLGMTYDDQAAMWAGQDYDALAAAGGTYDSREDA